MRAFVSITAAISVLAAPALDAQQQPLTRAAAVEATVAKGARLSLAAADTSAARGLQLAARALPNPALNAAYSESAPRYHVGFDLPVDYPWLRSTRIKAADATRNAAQYRFRFERAAAALDADTLYTVAQARRMRADLSRRNALDADSLRKIAVARRDAGDASDLDVELAGLFAGEQRNVAAADSLDLFDALLSLQTVMGMPADSVRIALADSLMAPTADAVRPGAGVTLSIAAAEAGLDATELLARLERRNKWAPPSIAFGFETRDPGGAENKLLPTFGLSLPLPLLDFNRGPIALAEAERDRARALLALARAESQAGIAHAVRERDQTVARVERGRTLVASANRVAAMSLTAFREGAAPMTSVLEAQRTARDILGTYIDDLARAWIAIATTRVLTLTVTPDSPK